MHLQQLISFLEVSRTLNMRKAAEKLAMTQPALSAQIRNLEEEYGAVLFERSFKGLTLTAAGEILVRYAEEILWLLEESRKEIEDLEREPQGVIRLGAVPSIVLALLPRMMPYFQNRYPQVKIHVDTLTPLDLLNRLIRHELDVVLTYGEQGGEGLRKHTLYYERFVLIAPEESAFEGGAWHEAPLILPTAGTLERKLIDEYFRQQGRSVRICMEVSSPEEIKRMVEKKVGFGIVPKSSLQRERDRVAVCPRPASLFETPVNLYLRKRGYLPVAVRKFAEDLLGLQSFSVFDL